MQTLRTIVIAFVAMLTSFRADAQDVSSHATILGGKATIYPHYSDHAGTQADTLLLKIKLDSTYTKDMGNQLTFEMNHFNLPNNPRLLNGQFTIDAAEMLPNNVFEIKLVLITDHMKAAITSDIQGYITLEGKKESFFTIELSPGHEYNPDKPFWVEVGANFDLVDNVKPDNVFAGVFFFQRDVMPIFQRAQTKVDKLSRKADASDAYTERRIKSIKKRLAKARLHDRNLLPLMRHNNLAFSAGIYESKASSYSNSSDNLDAIQYYDTTSFSTLFDNKAARYTDVGRIKTRVQSQNVGAFFSPQVRLNRGPADNNGAHIFLSLYTELQWQHIENTFDYSQLKRIAVDTVDIKGLESIPSKTETTTFNIFSHYEGFGLPVYIKTSDVNLYINPVFGMSNQPPTQDYTVLHGITQNALKREWRPFYLIQFRLSDVRYGFSLSGEVRGLIEFHSPPFFTLVLSKKFDLSKLIEFK
jgi:hypothetical protein